MRIFILYSIIFATCSAAPHQQKPIELIVISPSYNNAKWCLRNIASVARQSYKHWKMIIIDDCSSDKTYQLLHDYIATRNLYGQISLRRNTERMGAMHNWYHAIHACPDNAVIVSVDGDDWLAHKDVLKRIAQEYEDPNCWLTYGQFITIPKQVAGLCAPIPDEIHMKASYRKYNWRSSHLRTFYAWLFKKINKSDLEYNGKFVEMAPDMALMFPMLEMASRGHIRFIPDILYVYNELNPLCEHGVNRKKQLSLDRHIRRINPYEPL